MSVKKKIGLPAGKLIAIAGLAGLLAGGAAIYVKESLSGNGAVASADPAACAAAAEKAAAITPFSRGQVAAMRTVANTEMASQALGLLATGTQTNESWLWIKNIWMPVSPCTTCM